MNAFVLFGAVDVGEVIKILVILLVVFGSAIAKLISTMRAPKIPPVGGPQRPPAAPQPQPKVQVQADRPKSVKDEIDEFLRRAAQKRQSPSAAPSLSAFEQKQASTPRISQPSDPLARREDPLQAEVVRERPVGGEVSEHVKKYLDEQEFTQRAAKLGGDVAAADTKIERHLKEVFGHGISKLAAKPGETASAPVSAPTGFFEDEVPVLSTAGVGLASLLNNIDNLRQAIVVNEILQRPIDRWK